jgi:hypothetical protein
MTFSAHLSACRRMSGTEVISQNAPRVSALSGCQSVLTCPPASAMGASFQRGTATHLLCRIGKRWRTTSAWANRPACGSMKPRCRARRSKTAGCWRSVELKANLMLADESGCGALSGRLSQSVAGRMDSHAPSPPKQDFSDFVIHWLPPQYILLELREELALW